MPTPAEDITEYLANCNGFENHHVHPFGRGTTYSDGVKYVAEKAGAYWLIDAIMSHQSAKVKAACDGFQHWKLTKNKTGSGAKLVCSDGGKDGNKARAVVTQRIEFTDFPLPGIEFYLENNVLMLKAER